MRILHVNKFLYRRGGAEAYMEDLAGLQREAGHEVAFFGTDHPENPPLPHQASFPSYIEMEPPPASPVGRARAVGRMVWSTSARRGIAEVADHFRPDVVHMHNIYHHLSPSILGPVRARDIPVVMTLHDYKLVCPTYQLLDHGKPCEACIPGDLRNAVRRACKGGSRSASAVAAGELWIHRRTNAYDGVGIFICPSRFLRDKMREGRVYPDRMRTIPHFVETSVATKTEPGGPILFAGRLSHEKGVDVLVRAAGLLGAGQRVIIAGDGDRRAELEQLAAGVAPGRVEFLGRVGKERIQDLMRSAVCVVVPSRWHENQPMTVLEAFAAGVPVVSSGLGGLPELVEDGVTGRIVPADDPAALAAALDRVAADPARALEMGAAARTFAEREFAPALHVERVSAAYAEAAERLAVPA